LNSLLADHSTIVSDRFSTTEATAGHMKMERLYAGGPHLRALRRAQTDGAFLFPPMLLDPDLRKEMGEDQRNPGFVDYLFLAFNTSGPYLSNY
jgi:hypothetical protein